MDLSNKITAVDTNTKLTPKIDLCIVLSKQSRSLQLKIHLTYFNYSFKSIKKCLIAFAKAY